MDRTRSRKCEWCGEEFLPRRRGGEEQKYCKPEHKAEGKKRAACERAAAARALRTFPLARRRTYEISGDWPPKACTKCGQVKGPTEFYVDKRIDGLSSRCRLCIREDQRVLRETGRTRSTPRACKNCEAMFVPPPGHNKGAPPPCCSDECRRERTERLAAEAKRKRAYKNLLRLYNITDEQYKAMLTEQGGKCANRQCESTEPGGFGENWKVDHDHACCPGKGSCGQCVRGLLCNTCNLTLGNGKDRIEYFEGLVDYLKATRQLALFRAA